MSQAREASVAAQQQLVTDIKAVISDAEEVLAARRVNNDRRITVYGSHNDKALSAVGIAAGVGLLVGLIIGRR